MGKFFALLISVYQVLISPVYPPCCRFSPTCSSYAREAFMIHGVGYGGLLTIKRLLRCHPFCKGGFDPVPLKKDGTVTSLVKL